MRVAMLDLEGLIRAVEKSAHVCGSSINSRATLNILLSEVMLDFYWTHAFKVYSYYDRELNL